MSLGVCAQPRTTTCTALEATPLKTTLAVVACGRVSLGAKRNATSTCPLGGTTPASGRTAKGSVAAKAAPAAPPSAKEKAAGVSP